MLSDPVGFAAQGGDMVSSPQALQRTLFVYDPGPLEGGRWSLFALDQAQAQRRKQRHQRGPAMKTGRNCEGAHSDAAAEMRSRPLMVLVLRRRPQSMVSHSI